MRKLLLLTVFAVLVAVPAALAGTQPHGVSPAFITGPNPVAPVFGGTATFQVGGFVDADSAAATLDCFQGNLRVLHEGVFLQPGDTQVTLPLGPEPDNQPFWGPWLSGAASCHADMSVLWGKNYKVVDTVKFEVAAS